MKAFLMRLAMLAVFLVAAACIWAALSMVFTVSLFNILLGIVGAFFLLRGFELADRINELGPFSRDPHHDEQDRDREE